MRLTLYFKRLAFAQVVLGIVAFCMAEPNPGLMLMTGAIAALSWYVTEGPSGKPLPRWAINLLSLGAVAWLVHDLFYAQGHVIVAMGHFTMALQILMLYGPKANRDYAQILVLSLLTMIGASVLSVSMIYGLLLAGYCVLGLGTVLLFQLKSTADRVHEANRAAAPKHRPVAPPKAVVGRGYRWHLRFTALAIGVVCAAAAVATFVVMPRTGKARFGPELAGPIARKEIGFSETIRLGEPLNATATKEPVMNLKVTLHGQTLGPSTPGAWLLRGAALDVYDPSTRRWQRGTRKRGQEAIIELEDGETWLTQTPVSGLVLEGQVTLRESSDRTLFTVLPPVYFASDSVMQVRYSEVDQRLMVEGTVGGTTIYTIRWPLGATPGLDPALPERASPRLRGWPRERAAQTPPQRAAEPYATAWPVQSRRVARLARRELARRGVELTPGQPVSAAQRQRIAEALAAFLRETFTYTLDNPGTQAEDPVIDFLFNTRRGHCELFASAHAALCRSLDLPTRVVTGYRASEYNPIGGYFVVRQSHAHAWTEVHVGPELGWRTFDATPPAEVDAEHAPPDHWLAGLRQLYDHVEFTWLRTIVAYDHRTREAVMDDLGNTVETHAADRESWVGNAIAFLRDLPQTWRLDKIGYTAAGIVVVMLGVAIASLARLLILRRRKLVALQLTAVPRTRRRGLARKLRFYLHMLEMLERHGHLRPAWQSPFQFATELQARYPGRFDPVVALTQLFYEVRFGHRNLDAARKQAIRDNLRQLERALVTRRI
ncbi:MAG: DUF3488 domain-containing protein [Planctomycetes bacterium]|jgi:transglutaminase-like putative cysteine protease|nr:DUF3488 domain-containing protein [Planctomycetota bacterium]